MLIKFKKKNSTDILFIIYLLFVFCIPLTKLSIPAIGKMEFTLADLFLVLLFFIKALYSNKINKEYRAYIYGFAFFFFTMLINVVMIVDFVQWFKGTLPYCFSFFIMITTLNFFSGEDKLRQLRSMRNVIFFSLFISALPVYFQILTGTKIPLFYDHYGWRYTFLAQNPNQFGVYLILFLFLLTLITQKYFKPFLKNILLLQIFFFAPVMFSGSRTAMLAATLNLIILVFLFIKNLSAVKRIMIIPVLVLATIVMVPFTLNLVKGQGGQINRALNIFTTLEEKGVDVIGKNSPSGQSITEGKALARKYPIFGVGQGQKKYYSKYVTEIHNTYLKVLANTGLVGFLGFLIIFFLPLISHLFSKEADLTYKLTVLAFYSLFVIINYPHMLLRQRWVWLFMIICFIISKTNKSGNIEKSYLKILN